MHPTTEFSSYFFLCTVNIQSMDRGIYIQFGTHGLNQQKDFITFKEECRLASPHIRVWALNFKPLDNKKQTNKNIKVNQNNIVSKTSFFFFSHFKTEAFVSHMALGTEAPSTGSQREPSRLEQNTNQRLTGHNHSPHQRAGRTPAHVARTCSTFYFPQSRMDECFDFSCHPGEVGKLKMRGLLHEFVCFCVCVCATCAFSEL